MACTWGATMATCARRARGCRTDCSGSPATTTWRAPAHAVAEGADAIAFGSMFPSTTKPQAVRAALELLADARRRWPTRRVIAIGGIDGGNIRQVAAAGAHAAALISAVFDAADPGRAAAALVHTFNEGQDES